MLVATKTTQQSSTNFSVSAFHSSSLTLGMHACCVMACIMYLHLLRPHLPPSTRFWMHGMLIHQKRCLMQSATTLNMATMVGISGTLPPLLPSSSTLHFPPHPYLFFLHPSPSPLTLHPSLPTKLALSLSLSAYCFGKQVNLTCVLTSVTMI